jgi:catechol 2,3-dioxygenase-like lactoylglutathione lyase family enzyme
MAQLQMNSLIWYSEYMALKIGPIRHVGLFSPRRDEHARFYSEIWGLDQVQETADGVYFRGSSSEYFILSLHQNHSAGLHHIAYSLEDEDAVSQAAAHLKQAGIRIVGGPGLLEEPGGGFGVRFIDPDGRCIELSSNVATHANGWTSKNVEPRTICHVVNNTPDIARITNFYTSVLGLRVSDWSGEQMVFLRSDSKHHNLSFSAAPHASVNHIAYLVSGVDEVMRGIANLAKHGIAPAWGPGRHGPGNNIFCYFKDPFGYVAEYTSDIDYIADESKHKARVWPRSPESMDRWGLASPPSADLRAAMTGEPDTGWL